MSYIAIAGNIGVGKSELSARLAAKLGWKAFLEPASENPYLADFYNDMARWSFHSQIFFLSHRLRQLSEFLKENNAVVQDRSVEENVEIFARNLYEKGHLSERDWQTYHGLYETVLRFLPPPTLMVYLKASVPTLTERIRGRGRSFEQEIDPAYLEELNRLYDRWATTTSSATVLTIDTDRLNLVQNTAHLEDVANRVLAALPSQLPLYQTIDIAASR